MSKSYKKNNNKNSLQASTLATTTFLQALVNGPAERVVSYCNHAADGNVPRSLWFPVNVFMAENDDNSHLIYSTFSSFSTQLWNADKYNTTNLTTTTTMTTSLVTIDCALDKCPQKLTVCTAKQLSKKLFNSFSNDNGKNS